jgi:hypothetical protein
MGLYRFNAVRPFGDVGVGLHGAHLDTNPEAYGKEFAPKAQATSSLKLGRWVSDQREGSDRHDPRPIA